LKNEPLISVIINCYNSETFLSEAINSVLLQTYNNLELIFWDNQSTDNSSKIIKSFNDARIKYFRSDNFTSLYEARNLALEKCSGEFITFLDSDDIWVNDKLEKQFNLYLDTKSLIIYGKYDTIDKNGIVTKNANDELYSGIITNKLLRKNPISIGAVFIHKSIFCDYSFNKNYNLIGDFDLWFRLSKNFDFSFVDSIVEHSRDHDNNTSKILLKGWSKERRIFYLSNLSLKNIFNPFFLKFMIKTEINFL
jgi:glycosyltransferase involved in cell wall biosynthesis